MKKILAALLLASAMPAVAQETYENAKIAAEDLNGTARYVGMGGAMEALGADISTMATNPAGIGMFRRSNVSVSFGAVSQGDAPDVLGAKKTYMSLAPTPVGPSSRSSTSVSTTTRVVTSTLFSRLPTVSTMRHKTN